MTFPAEAYYMVRPKGLNTLRQLNKREITEVIKRISKKTRERVEVMSPQHFKRCVGIVIRLDKQWRVAPYPPALTLNQLTFIVGVIVGVFLYALSKI